MLIGHSQFDQKKSTFGYILGSWQKVSEAVSSEVSRFPATRSPRDGWSSQKRNRGLPRSNTSDRKRGSLIEVVSLIERMRLLTDIFEETVPTSIYCG
jgi:hypothetical protein